MAKKRTAAKAGRKKKHGKFGVGDRVRVKRGVADPDFPDIPLGGWVGTVREIDRSSKLLLCLIRWSQHTLDGVHPVFRKRCERDGFVYEDMWLDEKDIEPETGEYVPIEQPEAIQTRPLSLDDQDDRIRAVLALTGDDPLPDVGEETLTAYHAHLAAKLSFSFKASYSKETGPMENTTCPITVTGLLAPDDCDEFYGLLCKARQGRRRIVLPLAEVEEVEDGANRRLVDDYGYWFWNQR